MRGRIGNVYVGGGGGGGRILMGIAVPRREGGKKDNKERKKILPRDFMGEPDSIQAEPSFNNI